MIREFVLSEKRPFNLGTIKRVSLIQIIRFSVDSDHDPTLEEIAFALSRAASNDHASSKPDPEKIEVGEDVFHVRAYLGPALIGRQRRRARVVEVLDQRSVIAEPRFRVQWYRQDGKLGSTTSDLSFHELAKA